MLLTGPFVAQSYPGKLPAVRSSRFNYKFNYGVGGTSAKTWKRVCGYSVFYSHQNEKKKKKM